MILALVYYLTGSIWCSILAHLLNNGLQVVLMYLSSENETINAVKESEQLPFYIPLGGLVLFIVCLYGLLKEKTPLSPGWSNDYTQEELSENAV